MLRIFPRSARLVRQREKEMTSCIKCGYDVNGRKFCPECGTPVQTASAPDQASASCPSCGGSVRSNAAFCMHCGKSLGAQALAAVSAPVTAMAQPVTRTCPACSQQVVGTSAFCTN